MKSRELDQFYTKKEIAKKLFEIIQENFKLEKFTLVEPSAGTGSFSSLFHENSIAFDLEPKAKNIIQADFLSIDPISAFENYKNEIFTIGNPPFGKNSSLALKFLNHSAKFSKFIAFILPKTFVKKSMIKKIAPFLHCVMSIEIPKDAFIFNDESYDVPVFFQVWEKKDFPREVVSTEFTSDLFTFTTKDNADFAIRRVGGLSGKVIMNFEKYSEQSHYYIKISDHSKYSYNDICSFFIDSFPKIQELARNTAGNPSISKDELVSVIKSKSENS